MDIPIKPNVYLGSSALSYVDQFQYIGHIICCDLSDDADIDRERSLTTRGNMLAHWFYFCSEDVKTTL